ncbi:MAG: response regulator [Burkholderiales bacterium]
MTETPPLPETETVVSGRRILIVDDNRDAAISLSMLLELSGNKTETAYDGLAAIDAAARFEPDVVLLDIGLPGLNGYEVARRMRNEPWGKHVKLVAVTGWGHPEDRSRAIAAGFDAHLLKPVDHAALVKLLAGAGPPSA